MTSLAASIVLPLHSSIQSRNLIHPRQHHVWQREADPVSLRNPCNFAVGNAATDSLQGISLCGSSCLQNFRSKLAGFPHRAKQTPPLGTSVMARSSATDTSNVMSLQDKDHVSVLFVCLGTWQCPFLNPMHPLSETRLKGLLAHVVRGYSQLHGQCETNMAGNHSKVLQQLLTHSISWFIK